MSVRENKAFRGETGAAVELKHDFCEVKGKLSLFLKAPRGGKEVFLRAVQARRLRYRWKSHDDLITGWPPERILLGKNARKRPPLILVDDPAGLEVDDKRALGGKNVPALLKELLRREVKGDIPPAKCVEHDDVVFLRLALENFDLNSSVADENSLTFPFLESEELLCDINDIQIKLNALHGRFGKIVS